MSDWRNSEVEDAFWRELGETSHQMVPQQEVKTLKETVPCRLHINLVNDGGENAEGRGLESNDILWTNEELAFCLSPTGVDGSFPHASSEALPPALGTLTAVDDIIPLASQEGQRADNCFNEYYVDVQNCEYGSPNTNVMSEETLAKSQNCCVSLSAVSSADNGLDYMENNKAREDGLFYYELPDISNLEGLDEVLRNCDSMFGEWSNNAQSWFSSSSNDICVSENTSNSGLQCSPPELRTINSKLSCPSVSSSTRTGLPIINEQSCLDYQFFETDSATEQEYHVNGETGVESAVRFRNDYGFQDVNNSNMINMQMKLYEGQMPSDVEAGNQLEICTSSRSVSIPRHKQRYIDQEYFPFSFTSPDPYSFQCSGKQDGYLDPKFPSHLPTSKSPSQVQRSSPFHENLFMRKVNSKANIDVKHKDMVRKPGPGLLEQTTSVEKQYYSNQDTRKNRKMILQHKAFVVNKSSSMPSVHFNGISAQSISFKKLQNTMGQLDVRTKICIRDSLYRLARSAEQRHNTTCTSDGDTDPRRGVYSTGKQISSGEHVNVETETNPIDRSIAHLLFHRPSDIVAKPADDPMLLDSNMITKRIDGPIVPNQQAAIPLLVCQKV